MDPILIVLISALVAVFVVAIYAVATRCRRPGPPEPPAAVKPAPTAAAPEAAPALARKLSKAGRAVGGRLAALFSRGTLDDEFWEGVAETLIAADVGVPVATEIVRRVREARPEGPDEARLALRNELVGLFDGRDRTLRRSNRPAIFVVVGVNGSGKTTSIAKLAAHIQAGGASAVLGAADTYRAAADQQLRVWAERVGVEVVGGQPGADPAAVAFDALHAARARDHEVVIIDTAGRLHANKNLMDELGKVARVLRREAGELDEVLLVVDGTQGQNAIAQAQTFTEAVGVTGIVITKLDGTAKGGVAVAIEQRFGIPIKFIGVGEDVEDLVPFEPADFVDALLSDHAD